MESKDPILIFQRVIPHYRVGFFKALAQILPITVIHSAQAKGASLEDEGSQLPFPNQLVSRIYFGFGETAVMQSLLPLFKARPKVVISEFGVKYATLWCLWLLRPFLNYRLYAWTHGVDNETLKRPFQGVRGMLARFLLSQMNGILCYSALRAEILRKFVSTSVFVAVNTLDTAPFIAKKKELEKTGKASLRAKLGWKEQFHLIFIGRLIPEKKINWILEAHRLLKQKHSVALHFVGDGPLAQEIKVLGGEGVYFHGEIKNEERISEFLYASDLLFNPGRIGLSIVHAFSVGLPVLTCEPGVEGPTHSPEIEYLKPGQNGWICKPKISEIVKTIERALGNQDELASFSKNAFETVLKEASIEKMIEGFKGAIEGH